MDETRIYSVDSETFNKLSHANDGTATRDRARARTCLLLPPHAAMQDDVDQAVVIIERFQDNDHRYLLRNGDQEHCGHQCRKR